MRLSWNEIRARAHEFADKWQNGGDEIKDTQTFYNDFFALFDVDRRSVARYEEHVKKREGK